MATIKTKLKYLELTIPVTITNDDYQMVRYSADSHNIRELLALFFIRIFRIFNDILFRCNKRKNRVRLLIKKP